MKLQPSFRVDLQGGFINNNAIATLEQKNLQLERSLWAISGLLSWWMSRVCSHVKYEQPPIVPRPTPLERGMRITPQGLPPTIASVLTSGEELRFKIPFRAERKKKVAKVQNWVPKACNLQK